MYIQCISKFVGRLPTLHVYTDILHTDFTFEHTLILYSSLSKTSGTANSSITVSSKLWFLTYNANESDVFVWKDGIRMKLKNSDSAGSFVGTYSGKRMGSSKEFNVQNQCHKSSLLYATYVFQVLLGFCTQARLAKTKSDHNNIAIEPEACMVGDRCGLTVFIVDQSNLQSIPPNKYLFVYLDFIRYSIICNKFSTTYIHWL